MNGFCSLFSDFSFRILSFGHISKRPGILKYYRNVEDFSTFLELSVGTIRTTYWYLNGLSKRNKIMNEINGNLEK